MICQSCGRANELEAKFCKGCGAPLASDEGTQQNNSYQPGAGYQTNMQNQYGMPQSMYAGTTRMTKKEFDQCESIKPIAKNIRASAIIAYVIGAISLVANVILGGNVFGILDVVIVVGLGLRIQFAKSRVCAVILGVYSVFNLIYMLVLTGRPGGWLIIICAVYAIMYTFKYQKAWNAYQQTGQL